MLPLFFPHSLLLDRLPQFRSLRHLNLNGHELGPEGSKRLAHAMAVLASVPAASGAAVEGDRDGKPLMKPRLRRLELAGCRVGAAGCNHLARALEVGAGRELTGKGRLVSGWLLAASPILAYSSTRTHAHHTRVHPPQPSTCPRTSSWTPPRSPSPAPSLRGAPPPSSNSTYPTITFPQRALRRYRGACLPACLHACGHVHLHTYTRTHALGP